MGNSNLTGETLGLSFILPAYNEEAGIAVTIERLKAVLGTCSLPFEIIIVNDGSTDGTLKALETIAGIRIISHPLNSGYGSAIKTGILAARYGWLGIVDADGTYEIEMLPALIERMRLGFDMVIATRKNVLKRDKRTKRLFRRLFLKFFVIIMNKPIQDPNSGFRLFRREMAMTFFPFLCDTFSFTTTITLLAVGNARFVDFVPTEYGVRKGDSKINHFRDTLRMVQLVVQGTTFFNPIKIFGILAILLLIFVGVPAALLAIFSESLALMYVILGSASAILTGLGIMGDIVRVSSTKFDPKLVQDLPVRTTIES